MSYGAIVVGGITAIGGMASAGANRRLAEQQIKDARIEREKQQKLLDEQRAQYKAIEFTNPFADMENVFEDLTVNQQQAQFQAQQGAQQRANIMQNLKGAAGGSGIAGLAQVLANQGTLQTQQISASIGMQEAQNQMAMAKGAASIQLAERQGDQWVQQAEIDRQATLLGMQMGATSGANMAFQQSQANLMNAQIASQQAMMDFGGVAMEAAGELDFGGGNKKKKGEKK
tara:strand:+ start:1542 stop:2228 length:687 start_codon:yes stop_codon:yes gene_type:complete